MPIVLLRRSLLLVHSRLLGRAESQFLRLLVVQSHLPVSRFRHLLARRTLQDALLLVVALAALAPAVHGLVDSVALVLVAVLAVLAAPVGPVVPAAVLVVVQVLVVVRVGNVVRRGDRSVVAVVIRMSCNHSISN